MASMVRARVALADALQDQLNQGAVAAYVAIRNAELNALAGRAMQYLRRTGVDGIP